MKHKDIHKIRPVQPPQGSGNGRPQSLPLTSKRESLFLWAVVNLGIILSLFLLYHWLKRPPSTADVAPIAWPSLNEIEVNLRLALTGFRDGYVRTLQAYGVFLLISLSFLSIGRLLMSRLFHGLKITYSEKFSFSYLLGSLFFSTLWLVFGSLGIHSTSLAVVLALAGASGFFMRQVRSDILSRDIPKKDVRLWVVFVILLLVYSTTTIEPQTYSDTLLTHLSLPNLYIQNGNIIGTPYNIYTYFPQNTEMLVMWCLLLKSEMAAALLMMGFLAALLILVWGFLRRSVPGPAAWAALLLLCSCPTIVWYASTIKNDFPSGVFLFAHFCALKEALDSREADVKASKAWMLLAGLLCGGAMGHKFTAIISAFVTFTILIGLSMRSKSYEWPKLFSIGFGLSICPWLIRSLILTGDPIYPYLKSFLGLKMVSPWHSTEMISSSTQNLGWRGILDYFKLLFGFTFDDKSIHPPSWGPGAVLIFAALALWKTGVSRGLKIVVGSAFISWMIHLFYSIEVRYHMGFLAFLMISAFFLQTEPLKARFRTPILLYSIAAFLSSMFYASHWNRLRSSLSNLISGYPKGNYNIEFSDPQASNLRWMAHLINTRTAGSDGILLAGVLYSHEIKRKLYFSNDRDRQILVDLAENALDSKNLKDMIRSMGVVHLLITSDFLKANLENPNEKIRMTPKGAEKILSLLQSFFTFRFATPDGQILWLTMNDSGNIAPIILNDKDAITQPESVLSIANKEYLNGNMGLAYSLIQTALKTPMNRFNLSNAYLTSGAIKISRGEAAEGLADLETAIKTAPEQPGVYITLAKFYVILKQNIEKVPNLLQEAVERGGRALIDKEPLLANYIENK